MGKEAVTKHGRDGEPVAGCLRAAHGRGIFYPYG